MLRKVSCSWPLTYRVAAFQLLNLTEWWSRLPRVETNACFSFFCLSNMSVISFWLFFWRKFEHQQAGRLGRKYLCTLFHQRCNTLHQQCNTWQLFMYPFVHDRLWIPSREKCYSVHSTSQWCLKCKQRTQTQLEGTPGNGDRYTICTRNTSTVLQLWFTLFHGPPVCKEIAWVSDYRKIITGTPSITLFEVSLQYCFHHKTTFRPPAKRWVLFALSYAPFHAQLAMQPKPNRLLSLLPLIGTKKKCSMQEDMHHVFGRNVDKPPVWWNVAHLLDGGNCRATYTRRGLNGTMHHTSLRRDSLLYAHWNNKVHA